MTTPKKEIDIRLVQAVLGTLPIPQLFPKEKSPLHLGIIQIDNAETIKSLYEDENRLDEIIEYHNRHLKEQYNYLERIEYSLPARTREKLKDSIARAKASLNMVESIAWKRDNFIAPANHSYFEEKPSKADFEKTVLGHKYVVINRLMPRELFAANLPAIFPLKNRTSHQFTLGKAGSGKSELLKWEYYFDMQQSDHTAILLDVHGDLSQECLQLKSEDKDIIYISTEFARTGYYPRFNPFEHNYFHESPGVRQAFIALRAEELTIAFSKFMTDWSDHMKRMIHKILLVLLDIPGMRFNDFMRFLRPSTSKEYETIAVNSEDPSISEYFKYDFNIKTAAITKQSILTRLEVALANPHLSAILDCEKSTFDLSEALESGKKIIVNLSKGMMGENGMRILGTLLLSNLSVHVMQRSNIPKEERNPIFLYIDECQNLLTENVDTLLAEARKYNVGLILACQFLDQLEDRRMRGSILSNTSIKTFGSVSANDYRKMCKETGFSSSKMPALKDGKFITKVGDCTPVIVQASGLLVEKKPPHYISPAQLRYRKEAQKRLYYTKSDSFDHLYNKRTDTQNYTPVIEKLI